MIKDISPEINEISEGIALLKHLGAGEKYADLKESLSKKYSLSFQAGLRKFELLERIEQNAENVFRDKMNDIRYYFSVCSNNKTNDAEIGCAGTLALLWEVDTDLEIKNIVELHRYLDEITEEKYCARFGKMLQNYTDLIQLEDEDPKSLPGDPFSIIRFLMQMDISDEEKWKLQKIFCDRAIHQQKIFSLLEKAIEVINGFQTELGKLGRLFEKYWVSALKTRSFSALLAENESLDIPENPLGFHIRPSVICPNVISMQLNMSGTGNPANKPDYFKFGILFGEDFPIETAYAKKDEVYETYVTQALKLLSDKSKFEILSYIRDRSAYGSELAKHLNLTTATVSHHMNTLLSSGLVRLKRVDNRIYYISNKEALKEILHYCEHVLTGKD